MEARDTSIGFGGTAPGVSVSERSVLDRRVIEDLEDDEDLLSSGTPITDSRAESAR